jgi:hypothetical protein
MGNRPTDVSLTIGAVIVGIVYAFANVCALFFIGLGGLEDTRIGKNAVALGTAYLLAELLAIYVLLAWTSARVRNAAHVGFCLPWAILLLTVLLQLFAPRGLRNFVPMFIIAALVWSVRYPGEWLVQKLNARERAANDVAPVPEMPEAEKPMEKPAARWWIYASLAWAVIGIAHGTYLISRVPILGAAFMNWFDLVLRVVPNFFILHAFALAAPGLVFAVLAERAGAAAAFPRYPKAATWCAVANLVTWLFPWPVVLSLA